jgi:ribonuclease BN (tRNA processing enzyme)
MKHSVESYAIKLEAEGKTFVYSGDTGMTDYFAEFIRNCDLLLCEAAIADSNEQKKDAHLSAAQVCALSKSAKCKQVVLTHFFSRIYKRTISVRNQELHDCCRRHHSGRRKSIHYYLRGFS